MKLRFEEDIFYGTVRIVARKRKNQSIGTGFIVSAPLKEDDSRTLVLLVSNRHVLERPDERVDLVFHRIHTTKLDDPDLNNFHQYVNLDVNNVYYGHPDSEVDIACLNITRALHDQNFNAFYRHIQSDMFSDFSEDDLLPGADVLFVGYPDGRFDIAHNLPILRKGYIATLPWVDFNNKKQFVIDAQVFPGSSGSPVFTVLGNEYKLLGVVSQTMIRHGKLETIPSFIKKEQQVVKQTLGLGIVIKAPLIKELIDYTVDKYESKRKTVQDG